LQEKIVLDEDAYTEGMEKIIQARSYGQTPGRVAASRRTGCSILAWVQRDFFPDLPSLKLAKEISIASRAGDNAKLRELHVTPHCRGVTTFHSARHRMLRLCHAAFRHPWSSAQRVVRQ
jgi:hypothetical protein